MSWFRRTPDQPIVLAPPRVIYATYDPKVQAAAVQRIKAVDRRARQKAQAVVRAQQREDKFKVSAVWPMSKKA